MSEVVDKMLEKKKQPYEVSIAQHFHTYALLDCTNAHSEAF